MGRPRKPLCAWPDCDEPKQPGRSYCRAHATEYARNAYRKKHGPPRDLSVCIEEGCDQPRHKHYSRCHDHQRAQWRLETQRRGERTILGGIRILITDYYGDVIQEFIAQPVGVHPMPQVEAQRKAILASARADGAIVAIVE